MEVLKSEESFFCGYRSGHPQERQKTSTNSQQQPPIFTNPEQGTAKPPQPTAKTPTETSKGNSKTVKQNWKWGRQTP
jgi:hypothetical protein